MEPIIPPSDQPDIAAALQAVGRVRLIAFGDRDPAEALAAIRKIIREYDQRVAAE